MRTPRLQLALLAVVLSSPFWRLGHPLWEVDDARYAEIPREMVETGDWATPTLDYLDYVEKPPLIYWLAACSYSLFGVSELAARLPLALLAVLALAGTWWLGSWLFSGEAGLWGALILGTSLQFAGLSHLITPDMAVSAALVWATGLILRCLSRPRDAWASPLAWAAMALGFLSKGLIALLLPGLWTVALLAVFPNLRKGLKTLVLGPGPALFILIAAPWFMVMERRHPGFFHFFFIEQHFLRYLTPHYNRPGPWYYFFPVELAGTLPWTPLAAAAAGAPLALWRRTDPRCRQLCLWVWLVFAFFSASSSKLLTYILPLFAHQSILAGEFLLRLKERTPLARVFDLGGRVLASLLAAAAALLPWAVGLLPPADQASVPRPPVALALALLGAALWFLRRAPARAAWLALAVHALLLHGARRLEGRLSAKSISLEIRSRMEADPSPSRIVTYDGYLHGIPFYTRRPVDIVINWVGELEYARRNDPRSAGRIGDDGTFRSLTSEPRTYLVIKRKELEHVLSLRPPGSLKGMRDFGGWVLAEL